MRRAPTIILATLLLSFCSREPQAQKPLSEQGEKVYTMKGKILSRDSGDNTVRVDHLAIPGYMEAMTMDYTVRGADVASLPPDGASVEATLHVTDDGYWLTDVKKAQ
jgi:protein SCO1